MTITAHPKGKTRAQLKAARDRIAQALDQAENAKVRARSAGYCEAVMGWDQVSRGRIHCGRPATEIHHMIGGWRQRGKRASALAEHKQHVCAKCHRDITEHRLQRIGGVTPHWTDCYMWRVD